jgi:putative nucleotidyltransferase with HDIG domain
VKGKETEVDDEAHETLLPVTALCPSTGRSKLTGHLVRVQASTRQTWDEAVERIILPQKESGKRRQQLVTLLRTDYHLAHLASLEHLLRAILEDVVSATGAQRAAIALANPVTGKLEIRSVVVQHHSVKTDQGYSQTLAEWTFRHGDSLLCEDASNNGDLKHAHSVLRGSMASLICAVLRSPRRRLGVLHLDRGPMQEAFTSDDLFFADAVGARASVGIESALLVDEQRSQFLQTLNTLARAVEARDQYTGSHTQRVTEYALLLADQMGLSVEDRERIRVGTPLHDIGKIGISDAILRKPGKLTREEFEEMKSHPAKGVAILESFPALGPVLPIVRSHHERWDGRGYPDGLVGAETPQVARIVGVADAFDALTSERCYRRGVPAPEALAELRRHAGTQFDPEALKAFLAIANRVELSLRKNLEGLAKPAC